MERDRVHAMWSSVDGPDAPQLWALGDDLAPKGAGAKDPGLAAELISLSSSSVLSDARGPEAVLAAARCLCLTSLCRPDAALMVLDDVMSAISRLSRVAGDSEAFLAVRARCALFALVLAATCATSPSLSARGRAKLSDAADGVLDLLDDETARDVLAGAAPAVQRCLSAALRVGRHALAAPPGPSSAMAALGAAVASASVCALTLGGTLVAAPHTVTALLHLGFGPGTDRDLSALLAGATAAVVCVLVALLAAAAAGIHASWRASQAHAVFAAALRALPGLQQRRIPSFGPDGGGPSEDAGRSRGPLPAAHTVGAAGPRAAVEAQGAQEAQEAHEATGSSGAAHASAGEDSSPEEAAPEGQWPQTEAQLREVPLPEVHELGPLLGRLREMLEQDGDVPAELVRAVSEKEAFARSLPREAAPGAARTADPAGSAQHAE